MNRNLAQARPVATHLVPRAPLIPPAPARLVRTFTPRARRPAVKDMDRPLPGPGENCVLRTAPRPQSARSTTTAGLHRRKEEDGRERGAHPIEVERKDSPIASVPARDVRVHLCACRVGREEHLAVAACGGQVVDGVSLRGVRGLSEKAEGDAPSARREGEMADVQSEVFRGESVTELPRRECRQRRIGKVSTVEQGDAG